MILKFCLQKLLKILWPSHIHGALQLDQFLSDEKQLIPVEDFQRAPDLDEAEVELASEMVGKPSVVVVDSQVGGAHLKHHNWFDVSESPQRMIFDSSDRRHLHYDAPLQVLSPANAWFFTQPKAKATGSNAYHVT